MSHPGSFPGARDDGQPYPTPGAYEYPPITHGGPAPQPYFAPPPGYSPSPPMPPGAYPPPPAYYPYRPGHLQPHGHPYPPAPGGPPATNGLAIGSLVSSLVGIPAYFLCMPFIGSVIGIVLGLVALNQIGRRQQRGREMAIAGIAMGAGTLVGALVLMLSYSSSLFSY